VNEKNGIFTVTPAAGAPSMFVALIKTCKRQASHLPVYFHFLILHIAFANVAPPSTEHTRLGHSRSA